MAGLSPSAVIVICIVFLIAFQPSAPISYGQEEQIADAVAAERRSLEVLLNSSFGDFAPWALDGQRWLNLTGLRDGDGYNWGLLPGAQARAREQLQDATRGEGLGLLEGQSNGSVMLYRNVSGWLRGQWVRSSVERDLGTPAFNLSNIAPEAFYNIQDFGRNITGAGGKVQMRLTEREDMTNNAKDDSVHRLSARITFQDDTSYADGWTTVLHGVHHLESGSIMLTTTSEKFAGIFALPHFSLTSDFFYRAQSFLNTSLAKAIDDQEHDLATTSINPWTSVTIEEESPSTPLCEMVIYLQQHAMNEAALGQADPALSPGSLELDGIEEELRFPGGRAFPRLPDMRMSMLVYSPDCGFVLESEGPPAPVPQEENHMSGPKIEVYLTDAKHVILCLVLVVAAQLVLGVQQMKATTTPSTRSRISFYTLAIMSLGSGFAAFSFLFMSSVVASMFLTSMIVAFLLFLEGNFFGIKFLMDVWTAQEPERTERQRRRQEQLAAATDARAAQLFNIQARTLPPQTSTTQPTLPPSDSAVTSSSLPLPVTASQPATSLATTLANPLAQATPTPTVPTTTLAPAPPRPATFGAFYTRYWLLLLFIMFLSTHAATSWPIGARSFYANTLTAIYLSFWVPQIHRNILRNCRKPFAFRFVLGQSVLRLIPIAYLWCYTGNILFVEPDRPAFVVFSVWMVIQNFALAGQEFLGPRWCVSERWTWVPTAWEYHPILREDEEGATMPIGYSASSVIDQESVTGIASFPDDANSLRRTSVSGSEGFSPLSPSTSRHNERQHDGIRTFDCAICMQAIEAPVVTSGTNLTISTENHASRRQPTRRASTDTTAPGSTAESTGLLSGLSRSVIFGRATGAAAATASNLVGATLSGRLLLERQRREYMVTPCRHIFHTQCLEGWMGYRLQCPICRETLPPL